MPTGYTQAVQDGEITDFPTFAMSCARAFGALISMRDDDTDADIFDQFTADTSYHDNAIVTATARLAELAAMTDDDKRRGAEAAWAAHLANVVETNARSGQYRTRYESMLTKVQGWEPPTDEHVGLRDFMMQQLEQSLKFDCWNREPDEAPRQPDEWWLDEIDAAHRTLKRSTDERTKAIARAEQRTAWVRSLRESLEAT